MERAAAARSRGNPRLFPVLATGVTASSAAETAWALVSQLQQLIEPQTQLRSLILFTGHCKVYIILICIYSSTSLEPSWTNAAVPIVDTCLIIRNKWMMQYDYVCRWKSVNVKVFLSCNIHFGFRGGGNNMDVTNNPLIFSMRVLDVGSVLMQSNAVMAMYSTANICYF
jgi:hypothetical protein